MIEAPYAEALVEDSPYRRRPAPVSELFSPGELGDLDPSTEIILEEWDSERSPGAETVEEAAQIFERYGAVPLSPNFQLVGSHETAEELMERTGRETMELVEKYIDDPTVIEERDFNAYNGSPRKMFTTSYENIVKYFPPVVRFQRTFLRTMQAIGRNRSILPEKSREEGMVGNWQIRPAALEDMEADDPALQIRQQQSIHEDGVKYTVLPVFANVGRNGNFVIIEGYAEACKEREPALNRHKDALGNIATILKERPDALVFRRLPMRPDTIAVVNSGATHFVSAKSGMDVRDGIREDAVSGRETYRLGKYGRIIARAAGNVAYSDENERSYDYLARQLEEDLPQLVPQLRSVEPLSPQAAAIVSATLEPFGVTPDDIEEVIRKCLLWGSADDLYRPELATEKS